jgi:Ser/Thr protein kinase RdoA (MazF antagonist)
VVHNDLRRENVLIDRAHREIRLIDFEFSRRGVPAGAAEVAEPFAPATPEDTAKLQEVLPILQAGGPGRGTGTLEGDRRALLEILRDLRLHRRPAWQVALRRAFGGR